MDDPHNKAEFARAITEARSVLAYMRAVADRDSIARAESAKAIRESWAALRKY